MSFYILGCTSPCLREEGNSPRKKDQLPIALIGTQDLDGDFKITVLTDELMSNSENELNDNAAGERPDICYPVDVISDLRLSIFSEK